MTRRIKLVRLSDRAKHFRGVGPVEAAVIQLYADPSVESERRLAALCADKMRELLADHTCAELHADARTELDRLNARLLGLES
jgi:hypothetical protein